MPGMRETTRSDYTAELATQRGRERDEFQQNIDGKVADVVTRWDNAGRPNDGAHFANFETDDAAEAKRRVRRGFTLVNGQRKEALPEAERAGYIALAPMWYKDSDPDPDGWVVVQFSVRHVVAGEKSEDTNGDGQNGEPQPEEVPTGRRGRHSDE